MYTKRIDISFILHIFPSSFFNSGMQYAQQSLDFETFFGYFIIFLRIQRGNKKYLNPPLCLTLMA